VSAPVFLSSVAADAAVGDLITVTGAEARHAVTVQRRAVGEAIDLVDGQGARARGRIETIRERELDVRVEAVGRDNDPTVVLVQALAKGGRDEQAVEAATELGVTRVVPWAAERSIVQWRGPKAAKGRDSWAALAVAAAKQSRRALVPVVDDVVTTAQLEAAVRAATASGERVLVLHEAATVPLVALEWATPDQPVWLIVGPEGGVSDRELDLLTGAGAEPVVLGPHVLRASSAGPVAIAALAAARGTWW